jgi:hypothetical protein
MRSNLWKASTLVLAGALAFVVTAGGVRSADAENQPHMRAALESLERSKVSLEKADADKGGHRAKAIEATKLAIEETKKGIEFDNKN